MYRGKRVFQQNGLREVFPIVKLKNQTYENKFIYVVGVSKSC